MPKLLGERRAGNELHREKWPCRVLTHVVDVDDARMVDACLSPGFLQEPHRSSGSCGVLVCRGSEDLESDEPLQRLIECAVHISHSAAAELSHDLKVAEAGADERIRASR